LGFGVAIAKGKLPLRKLFSGLSNLTLKKDSSVRNILGKAFEFIKQDKDLRQDFSKVFVNEKVKEKFLSHPKLQEYYAELLSSNQKYFERALNIKSTKNSEELASLVKDFLTEHFKQDPVSKWMRNLIGDILKLWGSKKAKIEIVDKVAINSADGKIGKKAKDSFYKKYKTLCNTVILGGFAPLVGIGIGIPFAISSWLTNIQLKAGRIGIMKAMDELDNPKLFVDKNAQPSEETTQNEASSKAKAKVDPFEAILKQKSA